MTSSRLCLKVVACLLALVSVVSNAAESHSSSSNFPTNVFLSASSHYKDPPPGALGTTLDLNLDHLLRFSVGFSLWADTEHQTGIRIYTSAYLASLFWALSLGNLNWRKTYNFISGNGAAGNVRAVLCPGAEMKLFVPVWEFSPAIGIGTASWNADPVGTLGLQKSYGTYSYYSVGFDYLASFGYIGAGVNYAPELPAAIRTSPYVSGGVRLKFH